MDGAETRRSTAERVAIGTASLLAGILAWAVFSALPPMPVLIGTERVSMHVPVWYQASIFPPFAAFMTAAGLDAVTGRRLWWPRLLGGSVLMLLAGARLSDTIPISGHGACAAALITEALMAPKREESAWVVGMAAASLLVTAWYKLAVWGDAKWFAVSLVIGALVGGAAARIGRGPRVGQGQG